jgi:hypothetical protein
MTKWIAYRLYYLGNWFMDCTPFYGMGEWIKDRKIVDKVYEDIL